MKLYLIERAARNIRDFITFNCAHLLGKAFILAPRESINIEVTSICNLKCRFCAYQKKSSTKVTMNNEFFIDCIDQALAMGFRRFSLTPTTGDVFMDPNFFDKLAYLENHPEVESYSFFTNFTVPDHGKIEKLLALKKLQHLTISIYGHDLESFMAITQSGEKIYRRLIDNLEKLLENLGRLQGNLEFGWRSYNRIPWNLKSSLKLVLDKYRSKGIRVRRSLAYSNWGGLVTSNDVAGLDININSTDTAYKKGACSMLFNSIVVKSDGAVNGCPCRDVDGTLKLGDLSQDPLVKILSPRNQTYIQLIKDQQEGNFPDVCRNCDFYKSIYKLPSAKQLNKSLSLDEFFEVISV